MYEALAGIQVLEVSLYAFVPSAGAVLADWGADVVKVVHPEYGDPMWHTVSGALGTLPSGVSLLWELSNRGKRSVGIDIATPGGKVVLEKLARRADVFLTSFLPAARRRLGIDVDDIRALNPSIVYARGSGHGPLGPQREAGGFDTGSYWSRSGIAYTISQDLGRYPYMPLPAFGDVPSGFALAAGVTAALLQRERTGRAPVVDVSLLSSALWTNGPYVTASRHSDVDAGPPYRNALVHAYETKDHRYLFFNGIRLDRHWEDFCAHLDRPDLAADDRFRGSGRVENEAVLTAILDDIFAQRTLVQWCEALQTLECPWVVVQTPHEVHSDPQVVANGYIVPKIVTTNDDELHMPATPVQFDERALAVKAAPDPVQDTEEVLLELGYDWDAIGALKDAGAIS
jgi:crotonobetainyl-CoA:carnitine CoA-transferase CaiB-like acyl-CoA transferase